jgi:hypothetical protein
MRVDQGFASLRQYPPERTSGDCGHEGCAFPAKWVVLCVPAAAMRVCAGHLGAIWNEQGRPS